jgi:hypothetical protein
MTPLQGFASAIAKARSGFDSGGPWIAFYQAKQTAYAELIAALPEIEKVSHFWRYVQNMSPAEWLPIVERELIRASEGHEPTPINRSAGVALRAAKAHCANYGDNGHCLRINIRDNGLVYLDPRIPCGRCAIADGCACPYFEEIILPQCGPDVTRQYLDGLQDRVETSLRATSYALKQCSDCGKLKAERGRLFCAVCAKIRKRESSREHMRRKRGLDVEKTALVSPSESTAQTCQK